MRYCIEIELDDGQASSPTLTQDLSAAVTPGLQQVLGFQGVQITGAHYPPVAP